MLYCLQSCYYRMPQSRWFIQKRTVSQFWGWGSPRARRGQIWFLVTTYLFIDAFLHTVSSRGRRVTRLSGASSNFTRSAVTDFFRPHGLQHARPPCPSPTCRVHSDSRPSSQWCHPAISSSVVPFSSCPQSQGTLGNSKHVKIWILSEFVSQYTWRSIKAFLALVG